MIEVRDTWAIQIEITNKCSNRCSNCTHLVGYGDTWEIEPEYFAKALDSLKDWPKVIGMIGGDPTLHSKFDELVEIFKSKVEKPRRGLWTSNFRGKEEQIREDFGYINYNPHKELVMHQPVLCCSKDIIPDPVERRKYIDSCWLSRIWSPSITPKGAYRCEVAGCMDMILDYNLGVNLSLNWWARPLQHFEDQIKTFCDLCSICIPLEERQDKEETDDMTDSAVKLFWPKAQKLNRLYRLHNSEEIKIKTKDGWQPYRYLVSMRDKI